MSSRIFMRNSNPFRPVSIGARKAVLPLLLCIAGNGVFGGCTTSWKEYQQGYRELILQSDSSSPGVHAARVEGAHVITLENDTTGIHDNCMTCHIGIMNRSMRNIRQPYQRHPAQYLVSHPIGRFGCTICHGGNGESLNEKEAHVGVSRGAMTQVSCTKCHSLESVAAGLDGAAELSRGMRRLDDLHCNGCHRIDGLPFQKEALPDLTGIASKLRSTWLMRWLKDPKSCVKNATMPVFALSDEHLRALIAYLMTFKDSSLERQREPIAGQVEKGGNLLREARCISCHAFNGTGGHLAPDIGKIGNKVTRTWLYAKLRNPSVFQPGTSMPHFNYSETDWSDLTDYCMEEYTDYEMKESDEATPEAVDTNPEHIDLGRRIFKELRCGNCHTYPDGDTWMQLGPILTAVGGKKVSEINFGNSSIPRSVPEYLFRKILAPQFFSTPTNLLKMPDYRLSADEAGEMTIALLSLNPVNIRVRQFQVEPRIVSRYEPDGEFGRVLEKYQCYSCHSMNGRGYNLAYDLSIEGSRVMKEWLYEYLKMSYSIRPILVERMPNFRFSPDELNILTDSIMQSLTSGAVPRISETDFTPRMIQEGSRLFQKTGCGACHIVNDKGGYIGPSFTSGTLVGDKLQAGWIYRWLKKPQAIVPGVLEPDYGLNDEDALALTAYLMSFAKGKK